MKTRLQRTISRACKPNSKKFTQRYQRYFWYMVAKYGFQKKDLTPEEKMERHAEQLNVIKYNRKRKTLCPECGGDGFIDVPTLRNDCDVSDCPTCKGAGEVMYI